MSSVAVYKVRCPSCGKSLRMEPADEGLPVLCRACGATMEAPPAPLLGPLDGAPTDLTPLDTTPPATASPDTTSAVAAPSGAISLSAFPFSPVEVGELSPPIASFVDPSTSPDVVLDANAAGLSALALAIPHFLPPAMTDSSATHAAAQVPAPSFEPQLVYIPPPQLATPQLDQSPRLISPASSAVAASAPPPAGSGGGVAGIDAISRFSSLEPEKAASSSRQAPAVPAAVKASSVYVVDNAARSRPLRWTLFGVALAAVIGLAVLLGAHQADWFDSWETAATPQVRKLKHEAETLATKGAVQESEAKYKQIEKLIDGRTAYDADLVQLLGEARQDERRVFAVILSRMKAAEEEKRPSVAAPLPTVAAPIALPPQDMQPQPPHRQVASIDPVGPNPETSNPTAASKPAVTPADKGPEAATKPAEEQAPRHVRPPPQVAARDPGVVTDGQIGDSIQRGVDFLFRQFDAKTHVIGIGPTQDKAYLAGLDALAVYALLQAGQAIDDPRLNHRGPEMQALINSLKALPINGHDQTYARGLRATCLALFDREEDFKTLKEDADWLIGTTDGGAYTYDGTYLSVAQRGLFRSTGGPWDNSNSQYGLLGVWSAADADPRIEVPLAYWQAVERHWTSVQVASGEWGYRHEERGRLTMTCAGIASMFVAHEYIEPAMSNNATVGRDPFTPALKKALEWFETDDNSMRFRDGGWWGYALYGIERVGLASGFKNFGTHDWYRQLSAAALGRQERNGSWGDDAIDTSYALLFLSRGRHPVLMNKLRFDGFWSNRPRDLANEARFASRQLERPINWQVVNVENPWTNWIDSPVLYIASHEAPKLTDEQIDKIRKFSEAGGLIFTHADASSPVFDKWARELAAKLFPKYELGPIPDNHPLWTTAYKIVPHPPLLGVSNGSRLLLVHSPTDLAGKWQQREDRRFEVKGDPNKSLPDATVKARHLAPFELGVNLFLYAAGKRDLRNRLDSPWIAEPRNAPIDTVEIGRLRYDGNWDPEPGAWVRYANWFQRATGTHLNVKAIKLAELTRDTVNSKPFAHLTGTGRVLFTEADVKGLRAYVEGGGVVLVDATGGMNGFDVDVRDSLLPRAFPSDVPTLIDFPHPLLTATQPGMTELAKARVRPFTAERLGAGVGTVQIIIPQKTPDAKREPGAILITSLDLTSGLLGINTWGVLGFDPLYSQLLVKNAIFWTLDGRPTK